MLTIIETTLPTQDVVLTLSDLTRHRHYAQVAHMQADDLIPSSLTNPITPRLTIASPWSTQAVAGPQIIADDDPPLPTVELQREQLDNAVIASGLDLGGYVGTYYTLDIAWDDPSGTENNRIRRPDGAERTYDGGHASWSGLFFTGTAQYEITIGAADTQDNVGERAVILRIDSPDITIIDVQSSGQTGTITAELSQDIDDGVVQFDRQNNNSPWSVLSGTDGINNTVTTSQTLITGGVYTIGDTI
ncbi:MAG: hypothetical protein H6766_07080 [Candidatus Peribacteria bacterium]|nr:MAG: hypothetical protein H6766_07080 [Candidatus Peribacteria bacterium]